MFNKKILTLLVLIIILQTFGILYIKKDTLKSFYGSTFNKENLKNIWSETLASFKTEELPALTSIEKAPIKKFELTVSPSEWRSITSGLTQKSSRDQIDATLVVNDESFVCTVRISKGAPRHWKGDRKSIRLRFPNDQLFHGIREINLNIPETQKVIIDPVAWEFADQMGLVTPEFDLVKLEINGQNEGVHLLYEDVDRFFLERNSLMGYIFTEKNGYFPFDYRSSDDADYPTVKVINKKGSTLKELIWLNKVLSYPSLGQYKAQITKLIDVNQVLTWHSNALICGSGHQNIHNIKLFYNSSLQKFQFIPWDIAGFDHWGHDPRKMWAMDLDWSTNRFTFRLNQVPEFVEQRNRILWQFLNGKLNEENQLNVIDKYYKLIRYHIYVDDLKQASENKFSNKDFEDAIVDLKNWVKLRRDFIISELEKADLRVSVNPIKINNQLSSFFGNKSLNQGLILSLGTGKQSGVYVKSIKVNSIINNLNKNSIRLFKDANGNEMLDEGDLEVQISDVMVSPESSGSTVELIIDELLFPARMVSRDPYFDYWDKGYTLQVKPSFKYHNYILVYTSSSSRNVFTNDVVIKSVNSVTGSSIQPEFFTYDPEKEFALIYQEVSTSIPTRLLNHLSGKINENQSSKTVNLASYLQDLEDRNNVIIPSGNYILDETWKVGEDEIITITAGTKIKIDPGVSIYVRGVLNFEGNANSPIILDSNLKGQPWGCLVYHKTEKNSRLSHVTIRYAGMAKIDNVNFTGGVSVYDATILMESCIFDQIRADDGINVKNSKTRLLGCQFIRTKDDAIDYDFSSGEIRNCYFYKSGGDAIDCGSASPRIIGNLVEFPGDKCISVGEASSPIIENNFLIGGIYGIAIKDDSNPFISNNTIVGNKTGISFYIKKPEEFGAPTATIEKCILWDNEKEIENLSDSKFTIRKCAIEGGFEGEKIFIEPPDFTSEAYEIKLKYILKENSLYAIKGYGAKSGIWQ